MDVKVPEPIHESYLKHRKQRTLHIILPVMLTAVIVIIFFLFLTVTAFRGNGDVTTWAEVSTVWILVPIMFAIVILFALTVGLIYLLAKLLNVAPYYTGLAQDHVHRAASYARRGTEAAVKPVFFVADIETRIKRIFGIK
jgi:heme/copper-type cytochrome/quinol oxidase subunit 2